MTDDAYNQRVAEQIAQYAEVEDMHVLPEVFHFWSHNYVRPGLQSVFGVEAVPDFYTTGILQCGPNPRVLSIGCGDGWLEIEVAKQLAAHGAGQAHIVGADISPILLRRFQEKVTAEGLESTFTLVEQDLNHMDVAGTFSAIIANHSLHHIVGLENVFAFSRGRLRPGGLFITNDMIGRNGHQRWPETEAVLNSLWPMLDEAKRYHRQLRTLHDTFYNHDCSKEGFEGVRAQDILPLLLQTFHPVRFLGVGGFIDILIDRGYGHGYNPNNPNDRALIAFLADTNDMMLDGGLIKPTIMFGWFAAEPEQERFSRTRSARRSARQTD
jgi:SAM-dependent methyltransferase